MAVLAGLEGGGGWGTVLYDNVPGGAGHVRELLSLGRSWLEEARRVMYINEKHNRTCETHEVRNEIVEKVKSHQINKS